MQVRTWMTRGVVVGVATALGLLTASPGATASPSDPDAPVAAATGESAGVAVTTGRIAGANRYETAAKIANRAFPSPFSREGSLLVARGDVLADALSAGAFDVPLLLVPNCGDLPTVVGDAVKRVNPSAVRAVGGTSSVCDSLLDLAAAGRESFRSAGPDRYATSLDLADTYYSQDVKIPTVYVASGVDGTPDAVAGGVLTGGPILTVNPKGGASVQAAREWVSTREVGRVVALGGTSSLPNAVLKNVAAGLPTARLAGPDRYATSVAIGQAQFKGTAPVAYLARGDVFADAVAAGALTDGPVFLTKSCELPASVAGAITKLRPRNIVALGGKGAVCDDVLSQAAAAVGNNAVPPAVPTAISAGKDASCGIASGVPYCWGNNSNGQLGVGDRQKRYRPTPVRGLRTATVVSVGANHTCAISDAAAYCWGWNPSGQLGTGDQGQSTTPRKVKLADVSTIAAGTSHSCAISGAVLYCWGDNKYGQLGTGNTVDSLDPVLVPGLTKVRAVTTGSFHTCARTDGGTYCWGLNESGQVGDGTRTNATSPVKISGAVKFTDISAGDQHTCAIGGSKPYCWGENRNGELGLGNRTPATQPTLVKGLTRASAVSAGGGYTCAANGARAYCWGLNYNGSLGTGKASEGSLSPALVSRIRNVSRITTGVSHSCAVADKTAYCWGDNGEGGLGNGSPGPAWSPQRVATFFRSSFVG